MTMSTLPEDENAQPKPARRPRSHTASHVIDRDTGQPIGTRRSLAAAKRAAADYNRYAGRRRYFAAYITP